MKNRILLFAQALFAIALSSCQPSLNVPSASVNNEKLNSLMTLEIEENLIYTQDFILEPFKIDSVSSSSSQVSLSLNEDKTILYVTPSANMEAFVDIQFWVDGVAYSVPCRRSDKRDFVFTFDAKGKKYQNIRIAGQMNDWTPSATPALQPNAAGLYEVKLQLSPGTYLYQMNLDGEQEHDPNNPDKVDNGFGKYNSILQVPGVEDSLPALMTDSDKNRKIALQLRNKVTGVFVYWQNHRLPDSFIRIENNRIVFDIPAEALLRTRSYLRVWAMNDYGVSNDVLVPLHEGAVLKDSRKLTRHDHHAQIMYFMLVDRFKNGNPQNDAPLNLPDVHPKADYHGGDLAGLQQKISDGYFSRLGVNTLWVSPLSQNPEGAYGYYAPVNTRFSGYHGYWPVSSSKVDHRFGSNEELKQLVGVAHQKQMNVLLDYVANHVHELHPLVQRNPAYATPLYLPDGTMNVEKWDEQRLTTWFDTFMPTLDFSQPELVEMMTDSALFWLNEFNLDGFRHDACKHVDEAFWRTLTLKIRKAYPGKNPYQIGETYGSPKLIASYLTSGMLDGQFDFNVFDIANTAFAGVGGDLTRVNSVLKSSLYTYGNHNLMGYISGNHDKPRFMAYASGDLRFGEDAKAAGWLREIGITDSTAYSKFFLFHAFNMTIPGVPVIYYGDEIGMTGGNDPDCRKMMRFDGWNQREALLQSRVSKLANLRRSHPVLLYGTFVNILNTPETWVYGRKYFDEEALIIINNSAQPKTIEVELPAGFKVTNFKTSFGQKISIKSGKIVAEMEPYSAEVLLPKKIL
jgi:glycosidase